MPSIFYCFCGKNIEISHLLSFENQIQELNYRVRNQFVFFSLHFRASSSSSPLAIHKRKKKDVHDIYATTAACQCVKYNSGNIISISYSTPFGYLRLCVVEQRKVGYMIKNIEWSVAWNGLELKLIYR